MHMIHKVVNHNIPEKLIWKKSINADCSTFIESLVLLFFFFFLLIISRALNYKIRIPSKLMPVNLSQYKGVIGVF